MKETLRQRILRKLYPIIRKLGRDGKHGTILINREGMLPQQSFYDLTTTANNGKTIDFSEFKGKKTVLVNTASNCGYTGQFAELQALHEQYGDRLNILGFPANDFAHQEKSDDNQISQFCQINYGVTFPLARKGVVVKNNQQQPVFQWLTDSSANGWNDHQPDWNFSKFVVNEEGVLTHYFGPSVSPLSDEFLKSL